MRRIVTILAAAMAVVLATAVVASSTLAGGSVSVSGTRSWTFAAVQVTQGATYDVKAWGSVQTAKIPYFHVPGVSKSASGPEGQPNSPCLAAYESTINGQCVVVDANFGTLVGVVVDGDTGMAMAPAFVIGAGPSFVAPANGWLFLTVNDLNLTYWDNNGQFTATITGP